MFSICCRQNCTILLLLSQIWEILTFPLLIFAPTTILKCLSVNQRFWLFIARQWYLICSHEGSDIIIIIARTLLSPKTNFKINSSFQQFCRNPSKFLRLQPVNSSSLSSYLIFVCEFVWLKMRACKKMTNIRHHCPPHNHDSDDLWKSENSNLGWAMKDRDCQL